MTEGIELELAELVSACQRVAPASGQERAIQAMLRVAPERRGVSIEAQNGEMHFRAELELVAPIGAPFHPVLLPGRLITRFLRALQDTDESRVELAPDTSGGFLVRASTAQLVMRALHTDAWPSFDHSPDDAVSLSEDDAKRLRSVLFAASTEPSKGGLVGIRVLGRTVTALDNARIARANLDVDLGDCLIPASFLRESFRQSVGAFRWGTHERRIVLYDDRGFWSVVLMDLPFPDRAVDDLLGWPSAASVTVESALLRAAVDRVSVLDSSKVQLESKSAELILRAETADLGNAEASVPSSGDGIGPLWLDRRHLLEALQHHDSEDSTLEFLGDKSAIRLRGDRIQQTLLVSSRRP